LGQKVELERGGGVILLFEHLRSTAMKKEKNQTYYLNKKGEETRWSLQTGHVVGIETTLQEQLGHW